MNEVYGEDNEEEKREERGEREEPVVPAKKQCTRDSKMDVLSLVSILTQAIEDQTATIKN